MFLAKWKRIIHSPNCPTLIMTYFIFQCLKQKDKLASAVSFCWLLLSITVVRIYDFDLVVS